MTDVGQKVTRASKFFCHVMTRLIQSPELVDPNFERQLGVKPAEEFVIGNCTNRLALLPRENCQ
jgi:hypothetical protein